MHELHSRNVCCLGRQALLGYSGTAVFSRDPPLSTHLGIGHDEHDQEGRVVTAEFERFFVVSVYTPNSGAARHATSSCSFHAAHNRLSACECLQDNCPMSMLRLSERLLLTSPAQASYRDLAQTLVPVASSCGGLQHLTLTETGLRA